MPKIDYLGLTIDKHLTWKDEITKLCKKISPIVGILSKLRYYLPIRILLKIYNALIHSRLTYTALTWGVAAKCHLKRLQVLQNRAIKLIYKKHHRTSTIDLFKNISKTILPVVGLHKFAICKMVYKVINGLCFHNTDLRYPQHNYITSFSGLLLKSVRSNFGKHSFSYNGSKIFNELPLKIRQSTSFSAFSRHLRLWLLSENLEDCINHVD